MIDLDHIVEDPMDDEVGLLIPPVISGTTWNAERFQKRDKLFQKLKARKYYSFVGNFQRYRLQRVGQSYLYQVPLTKKGHLKQFRGKLIRIICVGRRMTDSSLMAQVYRPPLSTSRESEIEIKAKGDEDERKSSREKRR